MAWDQWNLRCVKMVPVEVDAPCCKVCGRVCCWTFEDAFSCPSVNVTFKSCRKVGDTRISHVNIFYGNLVQNWKMKVKKQKRNYYFNIWPFTFTFTRCRHIWRWILWLKGKARIKTEDQTKGEYNLAIIYIWSTERRMCKLIK